MQDMAGAIADAGKDTPSLDLGAQYAKAYMDSLQFATKALKHEINIMK